MITKSRLALLLSPLRIAPLWSLSSPTPLLSEKQKKKNKKTQIENLCNNEDFKDDGAMATQITAGKCAG